MKIQVRFMKRNALLGVFWRRKWFYTNRLNRRLLREVFIFLVPCVPIVLSWRLKA